MILQALHSVISGVITCYPLLGDIESETPFAVYGADHTVLRDKTGICGYEYTVSISVIDEDLSDIMTYSSGVKIVMDTLAGTTTQGTTFDMVHLNSEASRYDEKAFCFINDLEYKILTTNI